MTPPLSPKSVSPKTAEDANCFGFEVSRDMEGAETFEVICEVVYVEPPDLAVGLTGSTIELEAYTMDGRRFDLTPLEYDRALEEAANYLERWAEEAENDTRD